MPVADVKKDGPVECKLTPVERERLAGQEVHRNAVGTESVDDNCVIVMVGDDLQRQPGVAKDYPRAIFTALEKVEVARVASDLFNLGIDFVEVPDLSRLRVASKLSGAKPDNADLLEISVGNRSEEPAERSLKAVVTERNRLLSWVRAFGAVDRCAMLQYTDSAAVDANYAIYPKKGARSFERAAGGGEMLNEQAAGDTQRKSQRPLAKLQQDNCAQRQRPDKHPGRQITGKNQRGQSGCQQDGKSDISPAQRLARTDG